MEGNINLFRNLRKFEKVIIISLMFMMGLIILIATIDLGYMIVEKFTRFPLDINSEVLTIFFSAFLIVLIGIELLETIKAYLKEDVVHVEIVLLIAIIAIARKVIVMDYGKYQGIQLMGLGALMVALAVGYYLIKRADWEIRITRRKDNDPTFGDKDSTEKR